MRLIPSVVLMIMAATAATADPLTIDLPDAATAERQTVDYNCDGGRQITVEYVNAGANSMAIVTIGDDTVLMVTVMSGSGARYVGQQYEWWTKGDGATLSNGMQPDAQPLACAAKG